MEAKAENTVKLKDRLVAKEWRPSISPTHKTIGTKHFGAILCTRTGEYNESNLF